jgi:hypothetical protein
MVLHTVCFWHKLTTERMLHAYRAWLHTALSPLPDLIMETTGLFSHWYPTTGPQHHHNPGDRNHCKNYKNFQGLNLVRLGPDAVRIWILSHATFFVIFTSFLLTHYRCRRLLLHLITLKMHTLGRTPLHQGLAWHRPLYLTVHNTHKRQTSRSQQDSNLQSQQASSHTHTSDHVPPGAAQAMITNVI